MPMKELLNWRQSALHVTAFFDRMNFFLILLYARAEPIICNFNGRTSLHLAVSCDKLEMTRILGNAGGHSILVRLFFTLLV